MKKFRFTFTALLIMLMGTIAFLGLRQVPINAAPAEVGVIAEADVPDWIKGHELSVKAKFAQAYDDAGFTGDALGTVQSISFGNHKRVALFQVFGTVVGEDTTYEGAVLLNEREGMPIVVTDLYALANLQTLFAAESNNTNAILLDIVISEGETYYVTDRRSEDGIFHINEENAVEYLDKRIGVGTGTYADIMWIEYTKAYKLSAQFAESLGLPLGPVARFEYMTPVMNQDGGYTGGKSLKIHTAQQFENGWIMQAPMQIRNADGGLGGHASPQQPAAPILNDMYAAVKAIKGNDKFEVTGMPTSVEVEIGGLRYQNFEFGYITLESGEADDIVVFYPELAVDDLGTEMDRRVGQTRTWDNLRIGHGDNNTVHGMGWERLRISQNYRNEIGRLIREGNIPSSAVMTRFGVDAPQDGNWFSWNHANFEGSTGYGLGGSNLFVFHSTWYKGAHALLPLLNNGTFVDSREVADGGRIGRPASGYKVIDKIWYQEFNNGIAYVDTADGNTIYQFAGANAIAWLDGATSIEEALIAKGLVQTTGFEVTFVDHDDTELKAVETYNLHEAAVPPADPTREDFIFAGWDQNIDDVTRTMTVKAKYIPASYQVVFTDHDDTEIETAQSVLFEQAAVAPADPEREHYVFWGWDKPFGRVRGDLTVKAVYRPFEYDVTYVLDDGVNHADNLLTANITTNYDLKAPTKDGFIFMGWFLDAEFTTPITKLATITENTTVYAQFVETLTADKIVGVFAPGTVPGWIKGHEASIKDLFDAAYLAGEFTVVPTEYLKSADFGRTRVMLYQEIPGEGLLVLNEREGEVLIIKDGVFIDAYLTLLETENRAILYAVVESEGETYYITDGGVVSFDETNAMVFYAHAIGNGTDLERFDDLGEPFTDEAILNDFNNAYKFAQNFMQSLGLPLGDVVMKDYTTPDSDTTTGVLLETTSAKKFYSQEFENGYIIMGSHGQNVQYGAAPILSDFYDLVVALPANATLDRTGAPVSIEMTIEGVRYQNFEFGYVKVEEGVAEFVKGWVVDYQGQEINRRVGTSLRFINWHWDPTNQNTYLVGWERLRITQNFRDTIGDMIRAGRAPYNTTSEDPFGDSGIHELTSRGGGSTGLWHIFKHGDGPALGWGNVFVLQGYWYNLPYELAPIFNIGVYVDAGDGIGRPTSSVKTLYNATYQLFDYGVAFYDGVGAIEHKSGDAFIEWMGTHETVEDALLEHGIAEEEHTVTWMADGEVVKTEQVLHGQAATAPADPVAPAGKIFVGWDPEEFDNIILPNRVINAVFGNEVGEPQAGTVKFINYDTDGETASFWYEDETQVIAVNALLYNTFRASRETMRESIDASGIPIYADAENLVTTLKWFYIEDGVVKQMPYTIGQLPESVESIVEIPTSAVISTAERRIIQDSFGDAHAFAFDRGGFNLGLPVAAPILTKEIPNASSPDVFYHVIVQEFEHGYIMQQGYNRAAFPIYGDMLDAWMQDHATIEEAINDLGVPYSRQHEHEGKVFQNFRYGHIIIEGSDVDINYEEERSLDIHMNEVDVRFGRWVNRSDARKAHPDFEHEFLRTYEAYIEVYAKWIAERDYSWGLIVEGNVIAWNTYGASQGFSMSSSTSNQWGQTRFTPIPYLSPFDTPHPVRSGILDSFAALGGNEDAGPGFPLEDDWTLANTITHEGKEVEFDVMYQNFERGYIRAYIVGDSQESEYFVGYRVDEQGRHINMETNEVEETPEWILRGLIDGPEISKDAIIAKLNELKALRESTKELAGDIADLPSNEYFASKAILDQIDARIASIEELLERDDLTVEEIEEALASLTSSITTLNNQRQPGQGDAVEPKPEKDGLAGWAIALIVVSSVAVVGAVGFVLYKFVFLKKKE